MTSTYKSRADSINSVSSKEEHKIGTERARPQRDGLAIEFKQHGLGLLKIADDDYYTSRQN